MAGTVVENLSSKKLAILIGVLALCQLVCFLIGGLIAPAPSNVMSVLSQKCIDPDPSGNTHVWFYPRSSEGKGCKIINDLTDQSIINGKVTANQIVFTFQLPLPKEGINLDYSRWQQNLIGVLTPDIHYNPASEMKTRSKITIDVKMGYRNKGDNENDWNLLAKSVEERWLECHISEKRIGYLYSCNMLPLFELGSLHHDYYLLNIRLPVNNGTKMNQDIGELVDLWLVVINQNGGFTKVWLSLKSFFFPITLIIIVWFWFRIRKLPRIPVLLEYMLLILGISLTQLNLPIEFLTLYYNVPFMLLLGDIRQGVFYSVLLTFWIIFAGEHLMDNVVRNHLRAYWKHISAVLVGCLSMFLFDVCERGVQLHNTFYSIWVSELSSNIALGFIILAGITSCIYFLFLCYLIWKVFKNINLKQSTLPLMCSYKRKHYQGVVQRFKFLLILSLICALLTVVSFIIGQASEGAWKWDEDIQLQYTSAFFTGVYGMWNIYVIILLSLYAPSHKKCTTESGLSLVGEEEEEIEIQGFANSEDCNFTLLKQRICQ